MYNDVLFDLVGILICFGIAVTICVYMIVTSVYRTKQSRSGIKVLQEPGEYSTDLNADGTVSFVVIVDGQAKKITLRRGELK